MLSAVKQKSIQLFSEHVQRNVRRSQFSWQTVPNYRAMYSKATAAVGCPCTWHNELMGDAESYTHSLTHSGGGYNYDSTAIPLQFDRTTTIR